LQTWSPSLSDWAVDASCRVAAGALAHGGLVFDDSEVLKAAYRSPVGRDLAKDEEATITNACVYRMDATVQI
jgi:hypothetical protein